MLSFANPSAVAIGEAMIEMAPVGDGLFRHGFAGDTFNTAWHMAQALAGFAKVGFVSRIGRDPLSDAFLNELAAEGLRTDGIARDPDRTMGLYLIALDGVERSFSYWRDTSAARLLADDGPALNQALTGAGLIHLSGITLAILKPAARATLFQALQAARDAGSIVSFDPNIRSSLWSSREEIHQTIVRALELTDIALPSFDDEAGNWGDTSPEATVARFAKAGVAEIIVKNGDAAVTCHADGQNVVCETPAVSDICDTTGAGDAFNSGYLGARLRGRSPVEAVRHGQQMSGEVIRHFGARIPKHRIAKIA